MDPTIKDRSERSIQQISELLQMCLNTTYFQYNNTFYKQRIGAAMGSPVSQIVANLYMESFEEEALSTARNPPSLWFRYVDDTMTKIHPYHIDEFTEHLNQMDPNIKFTSEIEEENKLRLY